MYPFMINIEGKKIVVIGGGKVAAKRVHSLLRWQPHITIVSPNLHESLHEVIDSHDNVRYYERSFQSSDVEQAFLVIAATNDSTINQIVKDSCHSNQLINIVDDPAGSSFHFPAFYEKNDITVAVSTNGTSPSLGVQLRDEFAAIIEELEPQYITFLKEFRAAIKCSELSPIDKRYWLKEVLKDEYRHSEQKRQQLKEQLLANAII